MNDIYYNKLEWLLKENKIIGNKFKKLNKTKNKKVIDYVTKNYPELKNLSKIDYTELNLRIDKLNTKYDPNKIKFLSESQIKEFFKTVKLGSIRDQLIFELIFKFGLRASELCNINLDDVDLNNDEIVIKALKGGYKNTLPLSKETKKAIQNYVEVRQETWDNALIISERQKTRLTRIDIYRLMIKYGTMAKLPKELQHPHALRHSTATMLANLNVPVEHAQRSLRHRNIANTMIYYNLTGQKLKQVITDNVDKLGSILE